MNVWQTSTSHSDISKCSVIPSSIRYQEEEEEEEESTNNGTNNDGDDSSTTKNRMAIANQDFQPGDIVLRNAPLTCSSLTDGGGGSTNHCAFCFQTEQKLSRCARCQSIWYCSRDCQKQDFALHKKECLYWANKKKNKEKQTQSLSSLQNGRIQAEISLLIRTHAKIEQQEQQANKEQESKDTASSFPQTTSPRTIIHSSIQHLASLAQYPLSLDPSEESIIQEATSAILWFQQEQQAKKNKKKTSSSQQQTQQEIQQQIQELLRIFRVNNFGITDELIKVIASAVYPLGALLNHSCQPNCILRYPKNNGNGPPILEIVASRPIAKGEELTHSYVELVQPKKIRQERLKSNYGFDCHCPRCNNDDVVVVTQEEPSSATNMPKEDWMQLQDIQQVGIFLDYYNPCFSSNQKWTLKEEDDDAIIHKNDQATQELRQMATHLQAQAKQCMAMDNLEGEIQALRLCVGVLSQLVQATDDDDDDDSKTSTSRHETCLEIYQVRGDLLGSLLLAGQTEPAIVECEYVVAFLVSILCCCDENKTNCPNHPILGLQLFTLGDLYSAVGWEEKAQRTFAWARHILTVSHGSNSNMVQLLKDR